MDLTYCRDDVLNDDVSQGERQSVTYRRNCGMIKGDLTEMLPFIYIFQNGNCGRRFKLPMSNEVTGIFGVNAHIGSGIFYRKGLILPLATCRVEKIKQAFLKLKECVAEGPVTPEAKKRRDKAQRILRNTFMGQVRLASGASLDGCIEFQNNSELFQILFEHFEYIEEVLDNTNGQVKPVKYRPFESRTYGEFLEKFHRNLGDAKWGYSHCKIALLYEATGDIDRFIFSSDGLTMLETNLHKNFAVKRSVRNQPVTVRLEQEKRWDWIYLHLNIGKESVTIVLSNSFPPVKTLIAWLKSIARGDMPVRFDIEEEGTEKRLSAYSTDNPERILIHIGNTYDGDEVINNIVSRIEFVESFRVAIRDFFRSEFDPEPWSNHGEDDIQEIINGDPWISR